MLKLLALFVVAIAVQASEYGQTYPDVHPGYMVQPQPYGAYPRKNLLLFYLFFLSLNNICFIQQNVINHKI